MPRALGFPTKNAVIILFLTLLCWTLSITNSRALEINKGALALLVVQDEKGEVIGTGTGFVVEPTGVLITNYHVILGADSVGAVFKNGTRVKVEGVLALDRRQDWALLQLKKGFYSTLEIGQSASLKEYSYTTALGYPSQGVSMHQDGLEGPLVQTHGFVLGILPQALPDFSFIYTSTPFDPGYSGGPLLDHENKVVGLATLEGRSINLALPIDYIKPHLASRDLRTFQELKEQDLNSKEALYYRGNYELYALGNTNEAIRLYEQALQQDAAFVPARYDLAVAYRGLGETDKAIVEYEKVLETNPRFPEALSNLGGQYFRKGETEKAIQYFKRALDIHPNFVQALSNLGAALNKNSQYRQALPHLKRAIDLDPEFAVAFFNLGNSHFGLDKFKEAEEAFNTARTRGVDFLSLHWKLHEIYLKTGRQKEAVRELELIIEMDPLNTEAAEKLKALKPESH